MAVRFATGLVQGMQVKKQKALSFLAGPARLGMLIMLLIGLVGFLPQTGTAQAKPLPPASTVKLIFIHHSTGENWLRDDYGGLGLALSQNNYFVSDTNYGWGPNNIGDRTDIPNWTEWFASGDTPTYMAALFTEYAQHASYTRTLADPGGENQVIMFKSCFPNSALEGSPSDPPDPDGWLTVGHAKWIYNQILPYFGAHPEKLFIVIAAPPLRDGTYAANARAFNQWLYYDWLAENHYTQTNVAVFDFYNVLTGPNNHHRFYNGAEQHVIADNRNTLYYPSGDDHPSVAGSQKATDEFIELLNVFYNRWNPSAPTCHGLTLTSSPAAGGTASADTEPNCGASYYSTGTVLNLTANANFGYVFTNWSGDSSGSANPGSVTMDGGDRAVTANFSPAPVVPPDGAILHANRPTFDWPNYPGAVGYQIQVSKNAGFTQLVVNVRLNGGTNSTYTPASNLPANALLYWRYRAKLTAFTYTAWSPVAEFQTANPPSVPNMSAPANNALTTDLTPLLDWTNSTVPTGAAFDHYQVQIATDAAFASVILDDDTAAGILTASSYTPAANLTANTKYYWHVRAWNSAGDYSAWSASRYFREALPPPFLIAPIGGVTVGSRRPVFDWSDVVGVSNYTIQISKNSSFTQIVVNASAAASTYTPTRDLPAGIQLYWRLKTNGLNGPSLWNVTGTFVTP